MSSTDFSNFVAAKGNVRLWDYTVYEEDIYVGYRGFDSFGKEVSYPFGYGLSYTTFNYSNPRIEVEDGIYSIYVDVCNAGQIAGKEVVQLYVSAPDAAVSNKPEKELKSFVKTEELVPGQSVTVKMTVSVPELASFDEKTSEWRTDSGLYNFLIGVSSRDIRAELKMEVPAYVQKVEDLLKPEQPINTLER